LEKLPDRFATEGGPTISVAARNEVELVLPDAALDHIYRIAQEALTNALKHARARHVAIRLAVTNTQVVLTVRDDEVGLPQPAARGLELGLSSMRYRAAAIGARLFVTSSTEGGTGGASGMAAGRGGRCGSGPSAVQ
jgi:signal transduction histidine kinase